MTLLIIVLAVSFMLIVSGLAPKAQTQPPVSVVVNVSQYVEGANQHGNTAEETEGANAAFLTRSRF